MFPTSSQRKYWIFSDSSEISRLKEENNDAYIRRISPDMPVIKGFVWLWLGVGVGVRLFLVFTHLMADDSVIYCSGFTREFDFGFSWTLQIEPFT